MVSGNCLARAKPQCAARRDSVLYTITGASVGPHVNLVRRLKPRPVGGCPCMSKHRETPVFFDPDHKRWPRLRGGVYLTALFLSIVFGILVLSVILIIPRLTPLALPKSTLYGPSRPRQWGEDRNFTPRQRALREEKEKLEIERSKRAARLRAQSAHSGFGQPLTFGFYVNWDETSMSSLKENIKNLDVVVAESLHLDGADGSLSEDNPFAQRSMTDYVRTARPDLRIMALVNNFNGTEWESNKLKQMLADPSGRARC